jgi:MFS family permease
MLLVALHERPNFEPPAERVPEWLGWSADTAERGLATLRQYGLLTHSRRMKRASLSPIGLTEVHRYLLRELFAQYTADDILRDDDLLQRRVRVSPRPVRCGPCPGRRRQPGQPRGAVLSVCPLSAARDSLEADPSAAAGLFRHARPRPNQIGCPEMLWSGVARRFPVLGIRDFRLLLADRLLAPAAFAFSMVGVSFAVLNATGSTTDLSYVLAAQIVPSLLFALVGGIVADRVAPQLVIVAANIMIAAGEGCFGILVITKHGHPALWQMIALEAVTGSGMALFYPASQALLPRLVPDRLLQEASAISRLAMNAAQMSGAAVAGLFVAAAGPGWALASCGLGMLGTVPLLLAIRAPGVERAHHTSMVRDLRDGWSAFASRTWLWVITAQYAVVMAAWYGGFQVLGPVVAKRYLGGPAVWGAITAAEAVGLIVGGVVAMRFVPRRPMRFVALIGGACAIEPLSLAMRWPVPLVCAAAVALGVMLEMMMVQWTVTLARTIPAGMLARVSAYDVLGTVIAMPAGALAAGPLASATGVFATEYGAAAITLAACALAIIPRAVRTMRVPDAADREQLTAGAAAGS